MKLIICRECKDVVNLWPAEMRRCFCGMSGGRYIDQTRAVVFGPCIPFGISNFSLSTAISHETVFAGFVYGPEVPSNGTIIWIEHPGDSTSISYEPLLEEKK